MSKKVKKTLRFTKSTIVIAILILLVISLTIVLFFLTNPIQSSNNTPSIKPSDPQKVKVTAGQFPGKMTTFDQLREKFEDIADKEGALLAFDVLRIATLPPGIDLHLMGHIIGDKLYEQVGVGGMKICTHEFRNACSHSIVVNYLYENGEGSLPDIVKACTLAPGGKGAYPMCFHGLGHGILSFTGYDLKKTVAMCKKTGPTNYSSREYIECVGGAIMEIISGGDHDKALWTEKRVNYLIPTNPLSPCATSVIPDDVKPQCYTYLTPYLLEAAGADLSNPQPKDFEKAFTYCDAIPKSETLNRNQCYGGFGKEFIVIARGRDIRNIEAMPASQVKIIVDWCQLAHTENEIWACLDNALKSLYWGGENKPTAALNLCSVVPTNFTDKCFSSLYDAVMYYEGNRNNITSLCNLVPETQKKVCRTKFSL